jgi:hypothetical protein
MSSVTFTWDDFWAVYEDSPKDIQEEWLKQIDLPDLVRRLSFKELVKVFRCAPKEIVDEYIDHKSEPAPKPEPETKSADDYVPNFVFWQPPPPPKKSKLPPHINPKDFAKKLIR